LLLKSKQYSVSSFSLYNYDPYHAADAFLMPHDQLINQSFYQDSLHFGPDTIDVAVHYTLHNEREYYPAMPAVFNEEGDLDLMPLIDYLKSEGFPIGESSMIYYYRKSKGDFVYCGKDPLQQRIFVPAFELDLDFGSKQRKVTLQVRAQAVSISSGTETEKKVEVDSRSQISDKSEETQFKSQRVLRHGERLIGEVLELVQTWRAYYDGFMDTESNTFIKLTLNEAASKLEVSRKSLDDYYNMINKAKRFGFDFDKHYNTRFGILRAYVKQHKATLAKDKAKVKEKQARSSSDSLTDERDHHFSLSVQSKKIRKGGF